MIMDVVVYADVLCPWCYVQKKSLQNAMDRYEVRHPGVEFNVTWKPFLLHPTLQRGDKLALYENLMKPEKYEVVSSRIDAAARTQGVRISLTGNTGPSQPAHLLIAHTLATLGPAAQQRAVDAIFKGHFEDGRDISDENFLIEVGNSVGMRTEAVRNIIQWRPEDGQGLVSGGRLGLVEAEVKRCMTMGVKATPCVTIGRFLVGGYQLPSVYEEVFEKVRRERRNLSASGGV